jgi:two-component system, cell cycle response regulator
MHSVLVIDDSIDIHVLLAARLGGQGIDLHAAMRGDEGLERAKRLQPDLILLDFELPDATGLDLCRILKEDPETAHVPIIFLTGNARTGIKVQGLELGAVDYVTKPFDPEELRARVRSALRLKDAHDLLTAQAFRDATSGLWNRRAFDQRLAEEVAAAIRYQRHVALALVDLDHFKRVNDTYGHSFGDHVLEQVGSALVQVGRTADAACRFGGEEFAVIIRDTSTRGAHAAAGRILEAIRALSLRCGDELVHVTASVGVAGSDQMEAITAEGLVRRADTALYAAKWAGRDRAMSFSPDLVRAADASTTAPSFC